MLVIANLPSSLKKDEIVLLYVEDCDHPYKVQRTLLTGASNWFKGALSAKFMEGQKLELRFSGTVKATLEYFLYWLFHGTLPTGNDTLTTLGNTKQVFTETQKEQQLQVQIWVFTDEHLIPALKNAAITRLYELIVAKTIHPSLETIRYSYENTLPGSSLRKLMRDAICSGHQAFAAARPGEIRLFAEALGTLSDVHGLMSDLMQSFMHVLRRDSQPHNIPPLDSLLEDLEDNGA